MKEYSNKAIIDSLGLPMMTSFEDLSQTLRLSPQLTHWLTSENEKKYEIFHIPKKDGTYREICAPVYSLKIVQRWVLNNILYKLKVSPYSFGFQKDGMGSPLVKCAEKHKNNLYVLKLDIKNFYPSIKSDKVYHVFTTVGYNSSVANLLTNICVRDKNLPQGAVTSAYLANIVCRNLDYRIAGYCNRRDIAYTRYADDMTFSCDNRDVLKGIFGTIKKILKSEGFQLNSDKTLFMSPKCHKCVLGITINDNLIKAPKIIKRNIRAMIHTAIVTKDYSSNDKIKGYIAYVNSIESNYTEKIRTYIDKFYTSQYSLIPEIVEAYNKNKFYSDLPDMKISEISDVFELTSRDDEASIMSAVYCEYTDFLESRGIIDNNKAEES